MIQTFQVRTTKKAEFIDITRTIYEAVKKAGVSDGICIVYVPHTTAGVTINENADPAVPEDIVSFLDRIVPAEGKYRHMEGNSPGHIKASLMGFSQTLFLESGGLVLGTWQAIFLCEFDGPRTRKIHVKVIEE